MGHPRPFVLRGWNKAVAFWFPAHDNSLLAALTVVGCRAIGAANADLQSIKFAAARFERMAQRVSVRGGFEVEWQADRRGAES